VTDLEKLNDVLKDLGVAKRIQFGTVESIPEGRIALNIMGSLFVFNDDGVYQGTLSQDMANETWKQAEKNPIKDGNEYYDDTAVVTNTTPNPDPKTERYRDALQEIADSGGVSAGTVFGGAATHMVRIAQNALGGGK